MLTEAQREERKRYIGSSDAPAVFGCDKYRSRYDLWLEKSGMLEPKKDDGNAATEAGNFLEAALVTWCESRTGLKAGRGADGETGLSLVHPNGISACNLDAIAPAGDGIAEIWECKTSGIMGVWVDDDGNVKNAIDLREWGAEGSGDVPERVKVQVYHQIAVARAATGFKIPLARVPALLGGRGLVLFRVECPDDVAESILSAEEEFMRLVREGIEPEDQPHLDVLKRVRRVPNKCVDLEPELVDAWDAAKLTESAAKKEKEALFARILCQMGDAEAGQVPRGTLTYYSQHRAGYTVEPSDFRVARFSPAGAKRKRK